MFVNYINIAYYIDIMAQSKKSERRVVSTNESLYTVILLEINVLLLPTQIGSTKTKENLKR